MTIVRRRLVFEGVLEVSAIVLPDERASRDVVLATWKPGDIVQRCTHGLVLQFATPRALDCDVMRGRPLIEYRGVLVGVPLHEHEFAALEAAPGSVVLARGGWVELVTLEQPIDPSEWLTLQPSRVVEEPAPKMHTALAPIAAPPTPLELRPALGVIDPKASRALVQALGATQDQPAWKRFTTRALRWWRSLRAPKLPAEAGRPGLLDRFERWLNRQLDRTRLGPWLDTLNHKYVDRLLKMFDDEAIEDALKHAVPLSRKIAEPGAVPSHLPLRGRSNLELNFGARATSDRPSSVMSTDTFEALKRRYRAAAETLIKAGQIDEAAFVLADLLDSPSEAVDLFERHRMFDKAARLAEGRSLAPEMAVRLWVLAKNIDRAMLLARQHRVFAAVVRRLESSHLVEAKRLRLLWGEWLASSGDFAGAVKAVEPLPEAHGLALRWADLGIEAGGPSRGTLLVRKLELGLSEPEPTAARALEILSDRSEATARERASLANALVSSSHQPSRALRAPLAREALRAVVRDEAAFGAVQPDLLKKLIEFDDGPLRADVPAFAPRVRSVSDRPPRFERDTTALTPFDAVPLLNGGFLVALGENGVALVNHQGRVTWRADVPAFSLVASDEGPTVLALAPREDVVSVSRISVATRRAERWADVKLSCFSQTFRDGTWFIADGHRVLGIDVLGDRPTPLWELTTSPNRPAVRALASNASKVVALTAGLAVEQCVWTLPTLELQSTREVRAHADDLTTFAVSASGGFLLIGGAPTVGTRITNDVTMDIPGRLAGTPACGPAVQALPTMSLDTPDQLEVVIQPSGRRLSFGNATSARTRFERGALIICCDNGHVVSFDLGTDRLVFDTTVKP